ncbi:ATP-dependent DNA helicase pfh1 [Pseudolycoriella hygida]|uniref:ATP-dependent DNA helicase n=1 Tax=Pseudolycoriella hygida TaxID=35572 RepID=A0A9Q0NAQ0_9DIPT|nr:ATP-dependent DNA helicase pfh1 [Pseudolycoriella hygida]
MCYQRSKEHQNNPLYKDIKFSNKNLNDLPNDDIPDSLWITMDSSTNVDFLNSCRTGYTNENVNNIDSQTNREEEVLRESIIGQSFETCGGNETLVTLTTSAFIDVDGVDTSTDDIQNHILNHTFLAKQDTKTADGTYYKIPHSEKPVNQYGNPLLLLGLFPTLFPYGLGSPDDPKRKIKTCYKTHLQYLLSYQDRRFERHYSFIYVVFNILQRRNACYSAKLMMNQPYSQSYANQISKVNIISTLIMGGVLGPMDSYFGPVESQGRGSLHIHMLLWLLHKLKPKDMMEKIKDPEFRDNLIKYLEDIVRETITEHGYLLNSCDSEQLTDNSKDNTELNETDNVSKPNLKYLKGDIPAACLFTPDPRDPDYEQKFNQDIINLVNETNIHRHNATCYKYAKLTDKRTTCRMRFPRAKVEKSSMDPETGELKLRHILDRSRKLILKCYNTIASKTELSGVQVASYLMNYKDHYTNQTFENIYVIGIERYMQTGLDRMKKVESNNSIEENAESIIENEETDNSLEEEVNEEKNEEQFNLELNDDGTNFILVNQRVDYEYRPIEIENLCLYEFVSKYKKQKKKMSDEKFLKQQQQDLISKEMNLEVDDSQNKTRGRSAQKRYIFDEGHPQVLTHILMERVKQVIPVLIGPQIPRKNRESTRERYCRSILTLFYPWRTFSDLCSPDESWLDSWTNKEEYLQYLQLKREKEKLRRAILLCSSEKDCNDSSNLNQLWDNNQNIDNIIPDVVIRSIDITTQELIISKYSLNEEQKRAFTIITDHLDGKCFSNIDGNKHNQLIMCIPASAGTGKSHLNRSLTEYFKLTDRLPMLRKLAPTSVAANEMGEGGLTMQSFIHCHLSANISQTRKSNIEMEWKHIKYVFVDEVSMVGLDSLAKLSRLMTLAKEDWADAATPFGGKNMVFFGDLMQYKPVMDLPVYTDILNQEFELKNARNIFLEEHYGCKLMSLLNILEKQMRTSDRRLLDIQNRIRTGKATKDDHNELRKRVVGIGSELESRADSPWNSAPVIVFRNDLRTCINNMAAEKFAKEIGTRMIVSVANDKLSIASSKNKEILRYILSLDDNKTQGLPGYLPLVKNMPVMLTKSLFSELGVSNGSIGIFKKLIYEDIESDCNEMIDTKKFYDNTIYIKEPLFALVEVIKFEKLPNLNDLAQ